MEDVDEIKRGIALTWTNQNSLWSQELSLTQSRQERQEKIYGLVALPLKIEGGDGEPMPAILPA